MKKGISFFYGFVYDKKQRAKDISSVGFDCVMTNADPRFNGENGKISQQIRLFKKNNLGITSLHMQYKASDLPHFFMDDKIGEKLEKNLKKDLRIAKKYGFCCVVVHLKGDLSDVGTQRFKRILQVSEKLNVPLALENLNFNHELLKYFFDNFKSDCVKFCYDCGHNHCFDPEVNYLEEFGDRLVCVHLHDNMGENDDHTLNEFGNTDWNVVAKRLAKCPEVALDYEILFSRPCNLTYDVALKKCYKQACDLEKNIQKERNKLEKLKKSNV